MINKYFKTFVKTFFFTTIPFILIVGIIIRRTEYNIPYIRATIGVILISIFISLAIRIFKSEKGIALINSILGYILIIPVLFILRNLFGNYLFRFSWYIYIVMAVIGVIYGIALLVSSRKYKSEVDELNRLLLKKDKEEDKEED
ncbi:hypothetical protein RJI07_00730 [Mycoplasmatota bacterium WC30]